MGIVYFIALLSVLMIPKSFVLAIYMPNVVVYTPLTESDESITLDYQSITYNATEDSTTMIFRYNGSCPRLVAQFFTRTAILNSSTEYPDDYVFFEGNSTHLKLSNEDLSLFAMDPLFFRVVAVNSAEGICSNEKSQEMFYRIVNRGISASTIKPNTPMKMDIPRHSSCAEPQLWFIWPERNGQICYCAAERYGNNPFEPCAADCESDYKFEVSEEGFMIFNAPDFAANILVHFRCDETPCDEGSPCSLSSIVSSHRIKIGDEHDDPNPESCEGGIILYSMYGTSGALFLMFSISLIVNILTCILCRNQRNTTVQ